MEGSYPMPLKLASSLIPPVVLIAAIFWLVHAFGYGRDGGYTQAGVQQVDSSGRSKQDKYTLSFQAIVAFTAVYYIMVQHYHMMK